MLERVWEKGNLSTLLVGMSIGTTTMESSMEVPQKSKHRTIIWSSNLTPGHISGQNFHWKDTWAPMFIAALFTIAKTWKWLKCPSSDEWIKKIWYLYRMEYYLVIKKNKMLPFAATWMGLEILILSKVNQKRKTNSIWYYLYVESKIWYK